MITIKLTKAQVPSYLLRDAGKGRKFKAYVVDKATIPMTAGLWEGGSRDEFSRFVNGQDQFLPFDQGSGPWDKARTNATIDLVVGEVVKRHSIFCGKDAGFTFYVNRATLKAEFGLDAPAE